MASVAGNIAPKVLSMAGSCCEDAALAVSLHMWIVNVVEGRNCCVATTSSSSSSSSQCVVCKVADTSVMLRCHMPLVPCVPACRCCC
jgi:hypothetical protein